MSPRGREFPGDFLLELFEDSTTHEKIWYHLMDPPGAPAQIRGLWTSEQKPEPPYMPQSPVQWWRYVRLRYCKTTPRWW